MNVLRIMKPGDWVLIVCAVAISIAAAIFVWLPSNSDDLSLIHI